MRYPQLPLLTISCISVISIMGCDQNNIPSQATIQKSFQQGVPAYAQIESFQIEKSENLGTKTEPRIQARFTANLKIIENLYDTTVPKDILHTYSFPATDDKTKVEFIEKKISKGEKFELYGLSVSEQYADTWKTEFKLEENPFRNIGIPRSQYTDRTIIQGSKEEKKFFDEVKQENRRQKKDLLASLFREEKSGTLQIGGFGMQFKIKFLSHDKDSGDVKGTISFPGGSTKNIQGQLLDSKLTFTTTSFAKGKDAWGLGTQYSFDMDEQSFSQSVPGTWKHPGRPGGEASIQLK